MGGLARGKRAPKVITKARLPFSREVIFTRARVSLALLSLRENGDYSWSNSKVVMYIIVPLAEVNHTA